MYTGMRPLEMREAETMSTSGIHLDSDCLEELFRGISWFVWKATPFLRVIATKGSKGTPLLALAWLAMMASQGKNQQRSEKLLPQKKPKIKKLQKDN